MCANKRGYTLVGLTVSQIVYVIYLHVTIETYSYANLHLHYKIILAYHYFEVSG